MNVDDCSRDLNWLVRMKVSEAHHVEAWKHWGRGT